MNNIDYNKDYYKILGVDKNATEDEIKKVYRKAAIKFHPDHQQGKSEAEKEAAKKTFQEINEANEILSDKNKRAEYDQVREMGGNPHMGGFGFGGMGDDIMRDFMRHHGFGGMGGMGGFRNSHFNQTNREPIRGQNIQINVNLPFEEFFFGCTKTLDIKVNARCTHCKIGINGDKPEYGTCNHCHGEGMTTSRRGNMIMQETCAVCGGTGQILKNKCSYCNGTTIIGTRTQSCTLEIPKFSYSGFVKTYDGVGHCGKFGGESGNITIIANMDDSGRFVLNSDYDCETLKTIHFIPILKAITGGTERILTPYGYVETEIPRCFENPTEIVIKGKGLKKKYSNDNADLIVQLHWDIPQNITDKEKEQLKKTLKSMGDRNGVFEAVEKLRGFDDEFAKRVKENFGG